jgi:hypothetical protein
MAATAPLCLPRQPERAAFHQPHRDLSTGLATGAFNADDAPDIDLTDAATEQVSSVAMRIHQTAILLGLSLATSGLWGGDNPS